MEVENVLAKNISAAGEKAAYDTACKRLLRNKVILAWIMQSYLEEYRDCTIQEIMDQYIMGEAEISKTAVNPDEAANGEQITGITTEDSTMHESTVTFDIRFHAIAPKSGELVRLIINIEAQNDFYPGYPIVKRGIYYGGRMISSQYGVEFTDSHYEKIKKVYSIWICQNPPRYRKNTLNRYSIKEEQLTGNIKEKPESYDLMTVLMICLGDTETDSSGILKLLEVLLSSDRNAKEKKNILQNEFGIKMTKKLESEVSIMCNLSEGVEAKGIEKGIENSIENLMKNMGWSMEQAMDALSIPEEKRDRYRNLISM